MQSRVTAALFPAKLPVNIAAVPGNRMANGFSHKCIPVRGANQTGCGVANWASALSYSRHKHSSEPRESSAWTQAVVTSVCLVLVGIAELNISVLWF